jgi:predicted nucleic acid-binding Zn ribbon protein
MPIYEYRCETCEAVLELFLQTSDPEPKLCGYRCKLAGEDDRRGWGPLERQLSAIGGNVRGSVRRTVPNEADLKKAGFTTFHNQGGKLERSLGDLGPKIVREDGD